MGYKNILNVPDRPHFTEELEGGILLLRQNASGTALELYKFPSPQIRGMPNIYCLVPGDQ